MGQNRKPAWWVQSEQESEEKMEVRETDCVRSHRPGEGLICLVRGRLWKVEAEKWNVHFWGCKGMSLPVVVRRTGGAVRMSVAEVEALTPLADVARKLLLC